MEALRFQASFFTQLELSVYKTRTRTRLAAHGNLQLYPARCAAAFVLTPRAAYLRRCYESDEQLTKPQEVLLKFADAIRWSHLANFLREHLELCCSSAALFIAAAACPYVLPKPAVKPLQRAFAVIAFPLVGVSASLDALMDVAGGKINIHVLMALAGFASVFMGNPLEGGLLLAMFNLAHIGTWARLIWLWFSTSNM
nr:probable cadmium/zinc-transporting ATPase HMA1, chloroplastic [Ipomoea batatas]